MIQNVTANQDSPSMGKSLANPLGDESPLTAEVIDVEKSVGPR